MSDDITIDVGMDSSGYSAGAAQMTNANSTLQQSLAGLTTSTMGVQRALSMITPGRATLVGFAAVATAAANQQQNLSGLAATSAITGISTKKLVGSMNELARSMPLGNAGAKDIVQQFTQMGVSSAGSEAKIGKLATTIGQLSGATGEGPGGLTAGMVQFSRATGNLNLDPSRFNKMSDSLVAVSKSTGASATDILAFSKNIAPMAQAAGIGTTGILGISGAMSSMGEDGTAASTAVSKMMSDMSRAVREGGPEMKTYGSIVGVTADKFKTMFEADPLSQVKAVIKSVAGAGAQGPRQLEALGLDGIRSQRAFQTLIQQGGLDIATATAKAGYGSGDTAKAAEAAFEGLNDQFAELKASSEQLAVAFGAPLLGPLTKFVGLLKAPVGLAAKIVGSGPAQKGLEVAGIGTAAVMLGKMLFGPLTTGGLFKQALTSKPMLSFMHSVSTARGDAPDSTVLSRLSRSARVQAETMVPKYARDAKGNIVKVDGVKQHEMGPDGKPVMEPKLYQGAMGGTAEVGGQIGTGVGGAIKEVNLTSAANKAKMLADREAEIGSRAFAVEQVYRKKRQDMNPFARAVQSAKVVGMTTASSLIADSGRMLRNARVPFEERTADFGMTATARAGFDSAAGTRERLEEEGRKADEAAVAAGGKGRNWVQRQQPKLVAANIAANYVIDSSQGKGPGVMRQARASAGAAWAGSETKGGIGFLGSELRAAGAGIKGFGTGLANAERRAGSFGEMLLQVGKTAKEATKFAGSAIAHPLSTGGRGIMGTLGMAGKGIGAIGGALGMGGGIGMGIAGAGALWQMHQDANAADAQRKIDVGNSDINSTFNAYREASGRAGVAAQSVDSQSSQHTKDTIKNVQTIDQAKHISAQDIADAHGSPDPKVQTFTGSITDMVAQVMAGERSGGADAGDIKIIQQDLLKSTKDPITAQKVIDALPASAFAAPAGAVPVVPTGSNADVLAAAAKAAGTAPSAGIWNSLKHVVADGPSLTSDQGNKQEETIVQKVGSSYAAQKDAYGDPYATQQRLLGQNAAISAAYKDNNEGEAQRLSRLFQNQDMGKDYKAQDITVDQFQKAGGDWAKAVASSGDLYKSQKEHNSGFGKAYTAADMNNPLAANTIQNSYSSILGDTESGKVMTPTAAFASNLFDTRSMAGVNGQVDLTKEKTAIAALTGNEGDSKSTSMAGDAFVSAGQKSGMALNDIALAATKVVNSFDATSSASIAASQALIKIGQAQAQKNVTQTTGGALMDNTQGAAERVAQFNLTNGPTASPTAENNADISTVTAGNAQAAGQMKARIMASFNEQKQEARSYDAFTLQMGRAQQQFGLQTARTEHDFYLGRSNAQRDYQVGVANAEADLARGRLIANRDFNINLKRQIEDAAKSIYNPYDRIQTKATWDVQNLIVNMTEQNEAVAKQEKQLKQLRKMGLSKQAIDQLQLGDASNAQQVDNLVQDFSADKSQVGKLNKTASTRALNTKALFTDPANTALARSRQDLDRGLGDQAKTLSISLERNKKAMSVSMSDQLTAFHTNVGRVNTDFAIQNANASKDYKTQLGYMKTDLLDSDKQLVEGVAGLTRDYHAALHGQMIGFKGKLRDDGDAVVETLNTSVAKTTAAMAKHGITPADMVADHFTRGAASVAAINAAIKVMRTDGSTSAFKGGTTARAEGGTIPGSSPHSKSDNIAVWATAGEFMHPVDTVKHYGIGTMERIRTKQIPKEALALADGGPVAIGDVESWFPPEGKKHGDLFGAVIHKFQDTMMHKINKLISEGAGSGGSNESISLGVGRNNGQQVFNTLTGLGFTRESAAGVVGNLMQESGINPNSHQGGGGVGRGIMQWTESQRWQTLKNWAGKRNIWGLDTQVGFMLKEMNDRGFTSGYKSMKSVSAATERFERVMEAAGIPMMDRRIGYANEAFKSYDQGGMLAPGQSGTNHGTQPEPVLTPPQWQNISDLVEKVSQLVTHEESRVMTGAGASHMTVNHHETITYDHRNDFGGANIAVTSADPDDMARKLERKATISRVTQTRGVRR